MKKNVKLKSSKKARKGKGVPEPELPSLVMAMAKLVERLEFVERKMDQVLGRVSNLPSEMRNAVQSVQRPQGFQPKPVMRPEYSSSSSSGQAQEERKERMMYQAICADCRKHCEVPFKPTDRPVYCKECFAIRKAGHGPQDPDRRPQPKKPSYVPSALSAQAIPTLAPHESVFKNRKGKQKGKASQAKSKKKKR